MHTQCPNCHIHYRVSEDDLATADGWVQCSACDTVFHAATGALEQAPPDDDETPATNTADLFESGGDEDSAEAAEATSTKQIEIELPEPPESTEKRDEDRPEPEWLYSKPRRRRSGLWFLASLLTLAALAAQIIHFDRAQWLQHPHLGPWLERVYAPLDMLPGPPRDLGALRVERADVAGDPARPDTLRVTAVLVNQANFRQPLPAIYVRLEDRWGATVGHGFFPPEAWQRRAMTEVPAGARVPVVLDLADPGPDAVGFHIEACWIAHDGNFECQRQGRGAAAAR
jgi:predicted Zn finger-like uncharacterized protein